MQRKLDHDRLIQELQNPQTQELAPLYVVSGDEPLLLVEASDALRAAASRLGYLERSRFTMDGRADWSAVLGSTQNVSLFGDKRLIDISLPGGKPGRIGGDALMQLAHMAQQQQLVDTSIVLQLPRLDRATRNSKWCQALEQAACWTEVSSIQRHALPSWIATRLKQQSQTLEADSLEWMSEKVEGNLLAAFQEIQKLALIYNSGPISQEQLEHAVLNVARYSIFDLRDAMISGQASRTLHILESLQGEGENLVLVLWAVGEEIRLLARLAQSPSQDIATLLRQARVFGPREQLLRRALQQAPAHAWPAALHHLHDLDKLAKGLKSSDKLADPWEELRRLSLRIAVLTQGRAQAA